MSSRTLPELLSENYDGALINARSCARRGDHGGAVAAYSRSAAYANALRLYHSTRHNARLERKWMEIQAHMREQAKLAEDAVLSVSVTIRNDGTYDPASLVTEADVERNAS